MSNNNNNITNNDDNNNIIVTLPNLIIIRILSYLDDVYDRRKFTSTCKLFFEKRKILYKTNQTRSTLTYKKIVFPGNYKTIKALYNYDGGDNLLPCTILEYIRFYQCFDGSIKNKLPSTIKYIEFGSSFNQTLESLPTGLRYLELGRDFNQSLSPLTSLKSLSVLRFSEECKFNRVIGPDDLPSSLTQLEFGSEFNQPIIPQSIPSRVRILRFGKCFNQPLTSGVIPNGIKELSFHYYQQPLEPGVLPTSLETLYTGGFNQPLQVGSLPMGLKHLIFDYHPRYPHPHRSNFDQVLQPGTLPLSLESIRFNQYFKQHILPNTFPTTIKKIIFPTNSILKELDADSIPVDVQVLSIPPMSWKSPLFPFKNLKWLQSSFAAPLQQQDSVANLKKWTVSSMIQDNASLPPLFHFQKLVILELPQSNITNSQISSNIKSITFTQGVQIQLLEHLHLPTLETIKLLDTNIINTGESLSKLSTISPNLKKLVLDFYNYYFDIPQSIQIIQFNVPKSFFREYATGYNPMKPSQTILDLIQSKRNYQHKFQSVNYNGGVSLDDKLFIDFYHHGIGVKIDGSAQVFSNLLGNNMFNKYQMGVVKYLYFYKEERNDTYPAILTYI